MKRATGITSILIVLVALSSAGATSYYATCVLDPLVGARMLSPGKAEGEPRQCHIGCTRQLSPVCGSDGTTYGNECALCAEACRDSALYRACRGDCPCHIDDVVMATAPPTTNVTAADHSPGEKGALTGDRPASEPQDRARQPLAGRGKHAGPIPDGRERGRQVETTGRRKLKNRSPVVIVTHTELSVVSGDVTANALNQVTLDLRAELASPGSDNGASGQYPSWTMAVDVYRKVKGRPLGKLALVGHPVRPTNSSEPSMGVSLHIRGLRYALDLRNHACRRAGTVCVRLRPGTRGSHARVRGRPNRKVLRSCARLRCRTDARVQLHT